MEPSITLQFENPLTYPDDTCDFIILSGPITNYVRGSNDMKIKPILDQFKILRQLKKVEKFEFVKRILDKNRSKNSNSSKEFETIKKVESLN